MCHGCDVHNGTLLRKVIAAFRSFARKPPINGIITLHPAPPPPSPCIWSGTPSCSHLFLSPPSLELSLPAPSELWNNDSFECADDIALTHHFEEHRSTWWRSEEGFFFYGELRLRGAFSPCCVLVMSVCWWGKTVLDPDGCVWFVEVLFVYYLPKNISSAHKYLISYFFCVQNKGVCLKLLGLSESKFADLKWYVFFQGFFVLCGLFFCCCVFCFVLKNISSTQIFDQIFLLCAEQRCLFETPWSLRVKFC